MQAHDIYPTDRSLQKQDISRTQRIREGASLQTSLTQWEKYCFSMLDLAKRQGR